MANKPKKPCAKPGCPNLTTEKYCSEHQALISQERKDRHALYDKYKRDKKTEEFYKSGEWIIVRQQALIRDKGLCQECLKNKMISIATEVDHIIPIKVRWDLRLKLDNLRSLCHKCHMAKTAEDKRIYKEYTIS